MQRITKSQLAPAAAHQTTAPVQPGVEWLRPKTAYATYGIGKTLLYELINDGKIRSVLLRSRGRQIGVRLIHKASLDDYIAAQMEEAPTQPVNVNR